MKIYVDESFRDLAPPIPLLYPFWDTSVDRREPNSTRFDRLVATAPEFIELTGLDNADIAVLPISWELVEDRPDRQDLVRDLAFRVGAANKRLAIFFWSDSDRPVPIPNSVVFRTSLYKSTQRPNEFAVSAWSEDFVEQYASGNLPLRPKNDVPTVGFCGYAGFKAWGVNPLLHAKAVARRIKHRTRSHTIREKALKNLAAARNVKTNFVIREHFLAGVAGEDHSPDERLQARLDYVNNMFESDYVLCARGGGNYSYRLYETLSAGRIPVFVNTDCVLPFDFEIDWGKYSVWVEANEVDRIGEKVSEFHAALTSDDFVELQREVRRFWEERISPEGFFRHLRRHFVPPAKEPNTQY